MDRVEFLILPPNLNLATCYLDQVRAVARFQYPIDGMLRQLKFRSAKPYAQVCAELLYRHGWWRPVSAVTTVPTDQDRLRHRGFNQAEEIARRFAVRSGLRYQDLLIRTRPTKSQTSTGSAEERISNLDQVFAVSNMVRLPQKVLLIDDTLTTGSTLNHCAQVLKAAGVKQVDALTVAYEQA